MPAASSQRCAQSYIIIVQMHYWHTFMDIDEHSYPYIYRSTRVYIHIHIYRHINKHTYAYIFIETYTCVHKCTNNYTGIYRHTHILPTDINICTYTHTYPYRYLHTYLYNNTSKHIQFEEYDSLRLKLSCSCWSVAVKNVLLSLSWDKISL